MSGSVIIYIFFFIYAPSSNLILNQPNNIFDGPFGQ
jgi:hypothetical protein